jgi:hypothetical protein
MNTDTDQIIFTISRIGSRIKSDIIRSVNTPNSQLPNSLDSCWVQVGSGTGLSSMGISLVSVHSDSDQV